MGRVRKNKATTSNNSVGQYFGTIFCCNLLKKIHFQFHGSDFNQARNPNNAEGWQYSDRSNLVQMQDSNYQFPMDWETGSGRFFKSEEQAVSFALLDSEANLNARNRNCKEFEAGDDNENNDPQNCGKLNYASATWQPGSDGLFNINHDREKFSFYLPETTTSVIALKSSWCV